MDPKHRDRVAFLRICSGKFTREMTVLHARTGKRIRLANVHKIFGRDREVIKEAYPGDILGLLGHSEFAIGDTLTEDPLIVYNEIPRFPPECFAFLHNPNPANFKSFRKGLDQSVLEGIVQQFRLKNSSNASPLLAAVGPLQFDVLQYRLQSEYGVDTRLEPAPWKVIRWLAPADLPKTHIPSDSAAGEDIEGRPVVLMPSEWMLGYFQERNPETRIYELPPDERFSMEAALSATA